jgi:hypothetical protein
MDEGKHRVALTQSQIRRLVLVRYLFQIGIEQSHKGEPLASLAILPLHDSAELFLQSALEYCNGTLGGKEFMSYWSAFQAKDISLPYKDGMSRFNRARVSLSMMEHFRPIIIWKSFEASWVLF